MNKPIIKVEQFDRADVPDHKLEQVNALSEEILKVIIPRCTNSNELNVAMGAMSWVMTIIVKELVADQHQEQACMQLAAALLRNLQECKPV
jgi:hypothetical protein